MMRTTTTQTALLSDFQREKNDRYVYVNIKNFHFWVSSSIADDDNSNDDDNNVLFSFNFRFHADYLSGQK